MTTNVVRPTNDPQLNLAYRAARENLALIQLPPRDLISLTGHDHRAFLHSFCTNDINRLQAGESCELFICNAQGKTIGHGYALLRDSELIFSTHHGLAADLIRHLDRYIIREDVQLNDVSSSWYPVIIGGPRATAWMEQQAWPLPDSIGQLREFEWESSRVLLWRTDWLSIPAFLVLIPHQATEEINRDVERLKLIFGQHDGAVVGTAELFNILRVEQGTPLFGVDITGDNLPQEVDRDQQAISFRKGCYLGQETVARLDALGHVNRKLCGLRSLTDTIPLSGSTLRQGDKSVGTLTSAILSPDLGPIGMGYVRREAFELGTRLDSDNGQLEVVRLPHATQ